MTAVAGREAPAAMAAAPVPPLQLPRLDWAAKGAAPLADRDDVIESDGDGDADDCFGGEEALDRRYERLGKVGEGNYGVVYQARHRERGDLVAVKWQHFGGRFHHSLPPFLLREISLLRNFVHPNVVRLLDVYLAEHAAEGFLVFEYVDMDLARLLAAFRQRGELMPMEKAREYSQQLLTGLLACHVRQIIHRDLKPQNILVGPGGLKICDFGLARLTSPPLRRYTHDVVTLWYRAPEILLGSSIYGPEVDNWSAGCCIAEVVTGRVLFRGDSEIGTIFRIFEHCGTPTEEVWPGVSRHEHWRPSFPKWPPAGLRRALAEQRPDLGPAGVALVHGLLAMNPQGRLSSRQAKGHAFFRRHGAAV